jgi:hypothetical protein
VTPRSRLTGFHRHAVFRINLPVVHPFEIIAAIPDANACAENCYLVRPTMNDRNPELAGRALLHQDGYVNLAVAVEIALQIK